MDIDRPTAVKSEESQALKSRVEMLIDRELTRCRVLHGPSNWREHGDWIRENVVAAAIQWMMRKAREGKL
ncbi:hypothetical protein [Burkholderia cepacia]|uniref:hypothetical protein n=1 Tax=Burkholderia cepacia TaxID=292 RepID=UPI000A6CD0FB|nr:hypothetical protein [Burkholderia cepacia]MCA8466615.1 hypothetical protein [Burkholderia cepacia]MDN7762959.1 hypothetical protein [Burkholderia cepacia]